jgi:regulator of sigma E protease
MGILTQALGLILSLSILVLLHEAGHFGFAKLFKTRVEKFYLFFDPWFSLFKFTKGETEYGIGWLPLGGYVKISGMIDESMDKEAMKQPAQPWEFRYKPTWQRLLIMTGGVLVNFFLALFIYSMILFTWGKEYLPVKNATYGLQFNEVAIKAGFQNGDKILKIDNQEVEKFNEITKKIIIDNAKTIEVERNGEITTIAIPADFTKQLLAAQVRSFADPRFPFIIEKVMDGNPAAKANMQTGDQIIKINNDTTPFYNDFIEKVEKLKGKEVVITFLRNNEVNTAKLTLTTDGKLGVYPKDPSTYFEINKTEYGFFASIPAGISLGVETLGNYIKQFKLVFTKEGAQQIGGFGAIGGLFPKSWDWEQFWNMTALLSVILAFMNILPIPALDGGHVMFLIYEMISGRKPNEKFMEYAQIAGMVILFGLLIFANGNDILKMFK